MAVRSFATNNLVEDHDNYVKFMKTRWSHLSKEDKNTDILFYKKGLVTESFGIKYSKEHRIDVATEITKYMRTIKLWHSITIAYNLWCEYSKFYIDKGHSHITYKQFVDISEDVLKKFKFRFEQIVKNAGCEYKGNGNSHLIDPCRLLAMFWTYLDIVKDTKTQRYLPNIATIERAVKVFGYKKFDNPFIMNGAFTKRCVRDKKEEEQPMEEKSTDILDTLIENLGLSQRPYNLLKGKMCCNTLRDVVNIPYISFVNTKYIHKATIQEIVDMLAKYGYEYKDIEKPATKIESVIDIAEQAAKEVEEERNKNTVPSTEPLNRDALNILNSYNILSATHDALKKKYEELLKTAQEQADNYDKLLKEKMDLENYNSRLRDENNYLKDKYAGIKARLENESSNTDIIAILSHVVDIMKKHGITKLETGIGGYSIDIIQKFVITGRS